MPENQAQRSVITGLSLGADHPGILYADSIHLESSAPDHARWYRPKPPEWVPPPPKHIDPISLPYNMELSPASISHWHVDFGRFDLAANGVYVGPIAQKTTGSMAYLEGGEAWTNYHMDTISYWGPVESLSLLVRFKDDANFISCAFSNYWTEPRILRCARRCLDHARLIARYRRPRV